MFKGISTTVTIHHLILLCALSVSAGENYPSPADSTAYHQLRKDLISRHSSTTPTIQTADALADEGFYEEAIAILTAMTTQQQSDATGDEAPVLQPEWKRYLSTGTDFFHLEDVDTVEKSEEELREYKRLTETPLSLWSRFRLTGTSLTPFVRRFSPEVYLSNYRTSLALPFFINPGFPALVECQLKAGKWFKADAQNDTLTPFIIHPSDMLGGLITIAPGKNGEGFGTWNRYVSIPFGIDIEHYHEDRSGYESFIRYMASPELQLKYGDDHGSSLRFSSDIRYDDYTTDESSYLDVIQVFASLEHALHSNTATHRSRGMWYFDNYPNRRSPSLVNRCRLSHKSQLRLSPRMELLFDSYFIYENETNEDSVRFSVSGTQNSVKLSSRISLSDCFSLEPFLHWEYRWAQSRHKRFVWRGFSAWEPMLQVTWTRQPFELMFQGSYFLEDIHKTFEEYYVDNKNIRILSEGSIAFGKYVTAAFQLEYHFRLYTDESRMTENITLAGTISASW